MALMYDMNTVNAAMMKAVEASSENLPEGEKLKKVLNCFAGMKPVEAEPVVHAMWERSRGNSLFRCTNCKHIVRLMSLSSVLWTLRCPNCGAKMDAREVKA